ncbi:primosomal protein N' (replication factor Y) [Weissella uvarum]|uniref:primosomal protein N' n=1 Tax=Weissella uvarum TaxID=1479233 RepID=UPI00195F8D06|nr:primosomal protein N' [Weissella uvarum]MBM7617769.1 primosomal protein N' (replication factor Y) [Weissella uvarum]MCM0595852.1 primosomal protein N' [Weissella uvarum]
MYAQVIVDVPTMQTNQPYTYEIPAALAELVQPGMRVVVPFGRGTRRVQGFVVGTTETTTTDAPLKSIDELIDVTPVLNHEMLALADWLAKSNFAFKISVLQAMLPNVMRAKYVKTVQLIDESAVADDAQLTAFFADRYEVPLDDDHVAPELLKSIQRLQRQGHVAINYYVGDKAKIKKVTALKPLMSSQAYDDARQKLNKVAKQQARLLTFLMTAPNEWIAQKQVLDATGIDYATLKKAESNGWIARQEIEQYRIPQLTSKIESTTPLPLTADQQAVFDQLKPSLQSKDHQTFLLEGVTGSGKTEIYLQDMAEVLAQGKTALMLVPEITLTPQMVRRVKSRFGESVAVLHSALSDGERYDEWRRIERGEAKVVVGARSAIFAPLDNLGLIILDEEHDASYKQEDNPRYHARDVAAWRAEYHGATLLLGSATPALESRARAQKGLYTLLRLPNRINQQPLPPVEVVDMRQAMKQGEDELFSHQLLEAIQQRLNRGEQSVLLLNRRGYANYVNCRDCGYTPTCINCDLALTMHKASHNMVCHYCGYQEPIPEQCPNCGSKRIRPFGAGTQKVETLLQQYFPQAKTLRMDLDTTRKKGATDQMLEAFGRHEADILLGTQMIAKGLDFPDVTLVGVLNADTTLALPDFRSAERTFQLLTQVSGRAGRDEKHGEVVVQTFNPEHYAIQFAKQHDYEGFYRYEMNLRKDWQYSPYFYTIQLKITHEQQNEAARVAYQIADWLKPHLDEQAVMLGPSMGSVARLNNKYVYRIIIKYKKSEHLFKALDELMQTGQQLQKQKVGLVIDRDPVNFV